jgi:sugar lactone lactonase YvrE
MMSEYHTSAGYYPSPWSGEDGGPQRLQAVAGLKGLDIQPGEELVQRASRRITTGNMVVLRDPGEVYLMHVDTLRGRIGMSCSSHVEKLDPQTLKPIAQSPALPGGKWWPGGFCVHRNGDLYVTFGRYMHRLDPDCQLVNSYRLPQDLPYNSHVVLDNGFIITKPISDSAATSICVIDPDTLTEACPHTLMPEPSISRLSASGNYVYVTGITTIYRYEFDAERRELMLDENWSLDYIGDSSQEYGWDPVIDGRNIWFMDNGRHRMGGTSLSLLGAGVNPTPNNLIRVSQHDASDFSITPISDKIHGTITNPPIYCPQRNIVVAFDSGNRFIRAWRYRADTNALEDLWSSENFGIGGHTIFYADSGELVTADYQSLKTFKGLREGEHTVVLDIETGKEKGRVPMGNYMQSAVFPAPAWDRGYYWLGLDKLSYITVE